MDPFPTYQTPYPRANKDDEQNPFIQFRRFADEQVSSLFAGFPQIFGLSQTSAGGNGTQHWKQEVEDIMRQRQEWEEGFRKQFEQEMEEMRQQLEKSKTEAWKSMEDAWKQHATPPPAGNETSTPTPTPWWTRGRAAKCPALNGQEPQKNATKCPALYDEQGQPKTELDAYDDLQNNSKTPVQEASKEPVKMRIPALGWDGQQMRKSWTGKTEATTREQVAPETPLARPTTYSLWAARRMQPFDNVDQTIPWLMLSPYSPIYLCNPAQSRLFKVKVQDSEGAPLQISCARFFERWYTEVDEKMASRKPWADAFEDLLSLQQTGHMVTRDNWNTWRTPSTWIHDMASRGSLGDRWGFNDQGLLVKRGALVDAAAELPGTGKEDRCARLRKNRECRRNKSVEAPSLPQKPVEEESVLVDKVTEALAPFPLFGSIISAADAIVSAVDQAAQKEIQAQTPLAELPGDAPAIVAELPADTTDQSSTSSSTYSSSSSSYGYGLSTSSNANSVVSTLTSTRTRTLPDGAIETKRVLKRRFADGSEQNEENVEIQNGHGASSADVDAGTRALAVVVAAPETEDKETQTRTRSDGYRQQPTEETRPQITWPEDAQQKIRLLEEELRRQHDSHLDDSIQKETGRRQPRQLDFSRRTPEVDENETQPEMRQQKAQLALRHESESHQGAGRRRGNGWFWN